MNYPKICIFVVEFDTKKVSLQPQRVIFYVYKVCYNSTRNGYFAGRASDWMPLSRLPFHRPARQSSAHIGNGGNSRL